MNDQITEKIKDLQIEAISKETKFSIRESRKISALNFVLSFFMMLPSGKFSLKSWAFNIFQLTNERVSHQAIAKKLGFSKISFVNVLFEKVLRNALNEISSLKDNPVLSQFTRVLVEDSTCFQLPYNLFPFFPGSNNKAKESATGKVQLCIDITKNIYSHIELMSFRDADAKYAKSILKFIKKGDLIIRDLGYWDSATFDLIHKAKAFFLSRLRSDVSIYSTDNESVIDILAYLKDKDKNGIRVVERAIMLSNKKEKYRMVCIKLTEAQAQQRRAKYRRRVRNGKDKPTSEKTSYLMSWNIFITNVERTKMSGEQIYSVYSLRWNIETIFKHWKSNLKLDNFVKTCTSPNPARLEIILMLYLTWIVLIYNPMFNFYQKQVYRKTNKILSPGKFADFIKAKFELICSMPLDKLIEALAYYCCFDSRKDRINYFEKLNMISLS